MIMPKKTDIDGTLQAYLIPRAPYTLVGLPVWRAWHRGTIALNVDREQRYRQQREDVRRSLPPAQLSWAHDRAFVG